MSLFTPASKLQLKGRVALCGPTGSGKTWTALEWAEILAGPDGRIAFVDTERGSAALYANRFTFDTLDWEPPYDPGKLVDVVRQAATEGYTVVVVDSLTHFWSGEGGTLDIVDGAAQRAHGNSFAGWKVGTPAQRTMVDTLVGLDAHVIVTMRSKMEYVLEEDSRGKKVPRKVGLAPEQRGGLEYEFTIVGDLDLEHRIVISKSRCDALADAVVQPGRAAEAARTFLAWLNTGEKLASASDRERLAEAMRSLTNGNRDSIRSELRETFGPSDQMRADDVDDAIALIVAAASPSYDAGDGGSAGGKGAASVESPPVNGNEKLPEDSPPQSRASGVEDDGGTPHHASSSAPVNRVAIVAREAGLDDTGRHELCEWASRGRVQSSKLLTEAETALAVDGAHKIKAGTHTLARRDDGSLGLKDTRFGFSEDPPTGSDDPVTVESMPLDELRTHLRSRLEPLNDAGKQAWKAAGLPALSRLTEEHRELALATVHEAEGGPF